MAKIKLNKLQLAQLRESITTGSTVKLNKPAKSQNKGWTDTALFSGLYMDKQTKLF